MRFAVSYSTPVQGPDPDRLAAFARHAEECGFEALTVPDHVALYPGARIGEYGHLPPDLPYPDPLDCLTFVAAVTDRLLLGTAVLLLPYRHPVLLAKRLATIDQLSRGRLRLLTVGVGVLPGEAAAVGVDFGSRGRRADEAIEVMQLLWSGGPDGVSRAGEFYPLDSVCAYPKPYGNAMIPIHVGGSSIAAATRAGRVGAGWFPGGMSTPQQRARQYEAVRAAATAAGRERVSLDITNWGSIDIAAERVDELAASGVNRVLVTPSANDLYEQFDQMTALAERFDLKHA